MEHEIPEEANKTKYIEVEIVENGTQQSEIDERVDKTIRLFYTLSKCFLNRKELMMETNTVLALTLNELLRFDDVNDSLTCSILCSVRAVC